MGVPTGYVLLFVLVTIIAIVLVCWFSGSEHAEFKNASACNIPPHFINAI